MSFYHRDLVSGLLKREYTKSERLIVLITRSGCKKKEKKSVVDLIKQFYKVPKKHEVGLVYVHTLRRYRYP